MSHSQPVVDLTTSPRLRPAPLYNSTPIRASSLGPAAQTAKARRTGSTPVTPVTPTETHTIIGDAVDFPAFLDTLSHYIEEIRGITVEKDAYTLSLICYVLNCISNQLATPDHAIIFTAHPDTPPTGDYLDRRCKPDIVARRTSKNVLDKAIDQNNPTNPVVSAPSSDSTPLPTPSWSEIIAVVEVKCPSRPTDLPQMDDYVRALFLYRMDLPVVCGLLWRIADLYLLQGGASGTTSQESKWEGPAWKSILYSYVSNIYDMEKLKDNSLSYSPDEGSWTVTLDDGESYNMYLFHGSSSPFRITTVFLGWKEDKDDPERKPLILKQSSLQGDPRFSEGPLYELAHGDDGMPGLARLEKYETKRDLLNPGRVRTHLILSSVGKPLTQCPSVFELLQVFFDLVVAHEEMCKRDVLHRDVSRGNIMCGTKDGRYAEGTRVSEGYIADIPNFANRSPTVLITDLDHGAQISEMERREPKGMRTVRDPIFIALEVAGAPPITRAPEIVALARYFNSLHHTLGADFSNDFFVNFKNKAGAYHSKHVALDFENALTQESTTPADLYERNAVVHEPRHDVESMFWLLCFALARANPKSDAPNPHDPTAEYSEFCDVMLNRHQTPNLRDNRGRYLERTEEQWKAILHPDLASLSTMLHHMGQYLAIRTFDNSMWGLYHAHETFKLLLFSAIRAFQSGDPILLCQHAPRYSLHIPGTRIGGNTLTITGRETPPSGGSSRGSLKRGSSQAGLDEDPRAGKRVKVDHPARPDQEEQPITNAKVMEHLRMLRRHNLCDANS